MNEFKRLILLYLGFLFVALGVLGALLPVVPSLPFFIIASVCFSKSSKKFHSMLMDNRLIGPHIRNYHENNGVPLKIKVLLVVSQWAGIIFSSILFVHNTPGRVLMVIIGISATVYFLSLKTAK